MELAGVAEVAALLGVTKQRVHQLAQTRTFPRPLARLAATPVWRVDEVERFAASRRKRPVPVGPTKEGK